MKRTIVFNLLILMVIFTIPQASANTVKKASAKDAPSMLFHFDDYTSETEWSSISLSESGVHRLGNIIAQKVCLVKRLYISQKEVAPGNPGVRMYIRKAGIYQSFNKLEKHYKKGFRKNVYTIDEAQGALNHILNVVIALHVHETDEFEQSLKKAKTIENQIQIYKNTQLTLK